MPSLHDIQRTTTALWLNKQARAWFLSGRRGEKPACLNDVADELLAALDGNGIALYADLLNFGYQDVMASIYPLCSKLLGKRWTAIVDDYVERCPAQHHNFNRLCSQFSRYLTTYGGTALDSYPFLPELADFEWIELEKMEEEAQITTYPHPALTDLSQISGLRPVLNPTVVVRQYAFDVPAIAQRLEAGRRLGNIVAKPTLVAVFRHPDDHGCRFVELGDAACVVVQASAHALSYRDLVEPAVAAIAHDNAQQAVLSFLELLENLQELRIFVGSQSAKCSFNA